MGLPRAGCVQLPPFVKLEQLPIAIFRKAEIDVQQETDEEDEKLKDGIPILGPVQVQPPADIETRRYDLFDDEEGDGWLQNEPDDWWE